MIPLKIIQLTGDQQVELRDAQAEITRMFTANPRRPGAILAQIIPPAAEMRVRVIGPELVAKLAEIVPPEWGEEVFDYRCPHCYSPLTDADADSDRQQARAGGPEQRLGPPPQ